MRYRYGPHEEEPEPWPAFQPASPAQEPGDPYPDYPTNPGYPTDQDYPTWLDEPADAARSKGLRHLSRLTFFAAQLSTAAAVGFTALFAQTAHTQAVTSPAPARTNPAPATVAPSPAGSSPSPTARPSPSTSARSAPAAGNTSSAAPAPTHTLAPPSTPPAAPPPSPAPVQTTTSGTTGG